MSSDTSTDQSMEKKIGYLSEVGIRLLRYQLLHSLHEQIRAVRDELAGKNFLKPENGEKN